MKRYIELKCLVIAMAAGSAAPAIASDKGPGLITDLQVNGSTIVFAVGGPIINKPACAIWDRFTIDVTTPQGQAKLAYLLSAQAMGKKVTVYGTGTCVHATDHEAAISVRDGQ